MGRIVLLFGMLVGLAGCCARGERATLQMLPDNATLPYVELLNRAKAQVSLATEAFYVDDWLEMQTASIALEQTARLLPKALAIPPDFKKEMPKRADELASEAMQLLQDTKAKDLKGANIRLQNIHLKIRDFPPALIIK